MPTLRIQEITCRGFDGILKFQPKLGNRKAGNPIKVDPPRDTTSITINFDPGDRLLFLKLDTQELCEGGLLAVQQGFNGQYIFDAGPGRILKFRYTVE